MKHDYVELMYRRAKMKRVGFHALCCFYTMCFLIFITYMSENPGVQNLTGFVAVIFGMFTVLNCADYRITKIGRKDIYETYEFPG